METKNAATAALNNQEMADRAFALAFEYEQKHGNCPQCVLAAVEGALGLGDDTVFKAGHGLAGGSGLTTLGTCGALVGAMLAIGVRYGRDRAAFTGSAKFPQSYRLSKALVDAFVAEYGSPLCCDIQTKLMGRSFNMWDARDYKAFEEAGGHKEKCPAVAGKAAALVVELLLAEAERDKTRAAKNS